MRLTAFLVGVCLSVCLLSFSESSLLAQSAVPSPWVSADIGNPSPAGTAAYAQSQFSLSGAGTDISGASDQFHFVYQPMNGDAEIVARVDSFTPADNGSKVGVMIRGDLGAGAANAFALLSGANDFAFQSRAQSGSGTASTAGGNASNTTWLRLTRAGTI